jgi:hypothetical protein
MTSHSGYANNLITPEMRGWVEGVNERSMREWVDRG